MPLSTVTNVIAIDPGTTESGVVLLQENQNPHGLIISNQELVSLISDYTEWNMAIEMVASYGMPVGREVFETVLWTGRFIQAHSEGKRTTLVYRKDVKLHLCGTSRAKEKNIRQSLIDRFGSVGTKKNPGHLYGFKSHMFSALAVGVTYVDLLK